MDTAFWINTGVRTSIVTSFYDITSLTLLDYGPAKDVIQSRAVNGG